MKSKKSKKSILIVVAHLDDETFGMYETIQKLKINNNITILSFCSGRDDNNKFSRMKTFRDLYSDINIIIEKYTDLQLHNESQAIISDIIKSNLNNVDEVFCCAKDLHNEHQIINQCTKVAIRNTSVKKLYEIFIPGSSDISMFNSKIILPIDIESKISACRKYHTEFSDYTENIIRTSSAMIGAPYSISNAEMFNLVYEII